MIDHPIGLAVVLAAFIPAVSISLAVFAVYLGRVAEKERERVEQLADRLRRLCESTGRPEIRTRRPRRLSLDVHMAIRALDRSLRSLERNNGIQGRRVSHHRLFLDSGSVIGDLAQRISRLEERGLR